MTSNKPDLVRKSQPLDSNYIDVFASEYEPVTEFDFKHRVGNTFNKELEVGNYIIQFSVYLLHTHLTV